METTASMKKIYETRQKKPFKLVNNSFNKEHRLIRFKVGIIGEERSGKTSVFRRFAVGFV